MLTSSRLRFPSIDAALILWILVMVFLLFIGCGGSKQSNTIIPTPGTILFTSNRALDGSDNYIPGMVNIWTIKSDGSGAQAVTQLTSAAYPGDNIQAVWSSDGSKIAYSSGRALNGSDAANGAYGTHNIWVMNADGTGATPLTKLTSAQMDCRAPAWSADGKKIAYYSARAFDGSDTMSSNPLNIWTINSDGSGDAPLTQVTAMDADSRNPRWSPDGTKLAFESQRSLDGSNTGTFTASNVWVVNADGSGAVAITTLNGNNLQYVLNILWSKDGSRLVFTIMPNNIWTAHPDGSGLAQLTNMTASYNLATGWSPDGTKLAFSSNRTPDGSDNFQEDTNVWVMNADGTNPTPLTKLTKAPSDGGVWSPDGSGIAYYSFRAFDGSDKPNQTGTENLWIVTPDGSSTSALTRLVKADSYVAGWKP